MCKLSVSTVFLGIWECSCEFKSLKESCSWIRSQPCGLLPVKQWKVFSIVHTGRRGPYLKSSQYWKVECISSLIDFSGQNSLGPLLNAVYQFWK